MTGALPEREESDHLTTLTTASRRASCQIVDIIQAILDCKIKERYLSADHSRMGLDRLLVDAREVKRTFHAPSPGLTCSEFSKALGLGFSTGKLLFHAGFFELTKVHDTLCGRSHLVVNHERYELFRCDYTSLSELAKGWMPHSALKKKLADAGIVPVWGIRERRIATFYRRAEIDAYCAKNP